MTTPELDLGFMVTGVVRYDPRAERLVLVVEGETLAFDVQEALKKYEGKEVRFTLASLETIATLSALVQSGEISLEGPPKVGG